jgi:hypothetical protein
MMQRNWQWKGSLKIQLVVFACIENEIREIVLMDKAD